VCINKTYSGIQSRAAETFLAFGHSVKAENLPAFLIFGNTKKITDTRVALQK